jgi:CheY-like chemotaxis protein
LQPQPVHVAGLISGLSELIASTLGPRIELQIDLAGGLLHAVAEANQLEMALLNLAVNARDAMPDGGVLTIAARVETIKAGHPARMSAGRYVRISVADTGVGMDEATVERAVEPFFSTKGVGKGTGLGLSMVHGLAMQLGGGLHISSKIGAGTCVAFWLPVSDIQADAGRAACANAIPLTDRAGVALLVDDEKLVRASIADMLSDFGYRVVETGSAEEALAIYTNGGPNGAIDLVVTDHLMPGMTGTDLAHAIHAIKPELPVLIISGYAELGGIAPDLPRLAKPFRSSELSAMLENLTGRDAR